MHRRIKMNNSKRPRKLSYPIKQAQKEYDAMQNEIPTDVLGSYTGTPIDRTVPEQDADDL